MSVATNPVVFTTGGTVQAGGGTYLPRRADGDLLALCRQSQFAYVLTARQMGKSSLMIRTVEQLAKESIRAVMIDLTQIGTQASPEQWYLGLLAIIEEQLLPDADAVAWWQANAHLGFTQRLTNFFHEVLLKEITEPVVIFVDEIDTTLSLDFTDDFYAAIRYLYNARATTPEFKRLSFVLIGVATPGDLIRDPQRTPFNIGQRVDLADFTADEALPLTTGLRLPPDEAAQALDWMMKWTNGHPYLTQRLCLALVDQRRPHWTEADVDQVVANTFFGAMSEQDNNLQFVRDMLTKRAPDVEGVLTTYREVRSGKRPVRDEEQSLVKSHMKLSGVVKRAGVELLVRNRIYETVFDEHWVRSHLPTNWHNLDPLAEDLFQLGQRFYSGEQLADAENLIRRALQINPNHLKSQLLLGRILLESNRAIESVAILEEAYRYDEGAAGVDLIKSLLIMADEQAETERLATYERVLNIDQNQPVASERWRAIWNAQGEVAATQKQWATALEAFQKAGNLTRVADVRQLKRKHELATRMTEATRLEAEENWDAAIAIYKNLFREYPDESELQARLEATQFQVLLVQYYSEAIGALETGDTKRAQRLLADVIGHQPDYKEAARHLLRTIVGIDVEVLKAELDAEQEKRVAAEALALACRQNEAQIEELREQLEASRKALTLAVALEQTVSAQASSSDNLKSSIEDLNAQRTQADTLTTLVRRAAQFAPRVVFFVIKGSDTVGWKAVGFENGLNDETVRLLSVPMQDQTLLREALTTFSTAVGRSSSLGDNSAMLGLYGGLAPKTAIAVPLVVRGKAAAVLYADSGTQSETAINVAAIEALLHVASMGIELLPARRGVEPVRPKGLPLQLDPPLLAAETPATQASHNPPQLEIKNAQKEEMSQIVERRTAPKIEQAETESPKTPLSETEQRAHNDARRFARLLVSEIKLYNAAMVNDGRRNFDLYDRLTGEIDRSRKVYEKRVSPAVAASFDYFYDELVKTLAEDDPAKLGANCPGPVVLASS